jgi:hypothetical protein
MFFVDFKKERAEEIVSAIKRGAAIPAPAGGDWNRYELLQVAGAMYFAIWSHGPVNSDLARIGKLPREHRDDPGETLAQDVHDAIEFCGQLTLMIEDGEYDAQFESRLQACGDGRQTDSHRPERIVATDANG